MVSTISTHVLLSVVLNNFRRTESPYTNGIPKPIYPENINMLLSSSRLALRECAHVHRIADN
jgi:hypothetical protein